MAPGLHPRELEPPAVPGERPGHGGHPVPCQQEARLRLVRGEREVIGRDLRPAVGKIGRRQPSHRDAERRQCRDRVRLEPVLPMGEPEHPGLDVEALAHLRLERLPGRAGLARPARVERVGPVRRPQDAGLVAGGRARVAGPERIDERRRPARPARAEGGPGAHRPRPDDDDVRRRRTHGLSVRVATAAAAIASRVNGSGRVSSFRQGSIWSA